MKRARVVVEVTLPPVTGGPGGLLRESEGVTASNLHGSTRDPWVTEVRLTRKGDLKLFDGLNQRAFYPAGQWTGYSVTATDVIR